MIYDVLKKVLVYHDHPGTKKEIPVPNEVDLKEWTNEEIREYLDYLKNYREYTYYYFKALATTKDKIHWLELKEKVEECIGREFTGRILAGVQSGIYQRSTKKGKERLDWKSEEEWEYSLNKKYRNKITKYFENN